MKSLLNQTLLDIEIIMVDDGSPDACPQICDDYARKDSRVKVIHKKNGGLGYARNSGIEIACGEYIAFVDSDDYIDHEMYELLYEKAIELDLDTVLCRYQRVSDTERIKYKKDDKEFYFVYNKDDINNVLLNMVGSNPDCKVERIFEMSTCTAIYSKKIIEQYNIRFHSEKEFISEDMIFQIDYLPKASRIAWTNKHLYYYCDNENTISKSFRKDRFDKYIILHNVIRNRLQNFMHQSLFELRVDRLFIGDSRQLILSLYNYKLQKKEKLNLIQSICENSIWVEIFNRYPYWELPLKYRLIMVFIKYKMKHTLLFISKLKAMIDK